MPQSHRSEIAPEMQASLKSSRSLNRAQSLWGKARKTPSRNLPVLKKPNLSQIDPHIPTPFSNTASTERMFPSVTSFSAVVTAANETLIREPTESALPKIDSKIDSFSSVLDWMLSFYGINIVSAHVNVGFLFNSGILR